MTRSTPSRSQPIPARDLIDAGVLGYRRMVRERPSLYRITFQRVVPGLEITDELAAIRADAFARLELRVQRLADAGTLHGRDARAAAVEFNAMCEGLANAELRGGTLRVLREGEEERAWRDAYESLVAGLAVPAAAGG